MHEQAIQHYFADKEPMLVEAVSRLVRIDSTLGPALPGKPFGEGPAAALEELLALARSWGLSGQNLEGYVGTVDLNDQETVLHILGHLDVVDPGEGWTVTEAFVPKLVDGLLYGRGTDDDKGPVAAALLAMKAVKDLGIPLRRNVRLIAGTDEETGFRDVKWYYSRHPYAPYTISPDADFPIINIEKGHYQPTFQAAWPQEQALPRVSDFTGGTRLNMVPPKAQATVLGLSLDTVEAAIRDLALEEAISFSCQEKGPGVHILCSGQNAHGSTPEEGHNAQTALVALLAALPGGCRLVLVGDPHQLPSVGPGNLLSDLLRSRRLPTLRLTEIFRQAAASAIIRGARAVDQGDCPVLVNDPAGDFFFLRRLDPAAAVETIVSLCQTRLPQNMGISPDQIQVLSPTRKGTAGTAALNRALQEAVNPPAPDKQEKSFGTVLFREGDRVMQVKNNYDILWEDHADGVGMGIFNGDIGRIESIDPASGLVTVDFDGHRAAYPPDMMTQLELAYAVTVHKAQGSEYRAVILSAVEAAPMLLTRGILYTAMTRAKELLILVGDDQVVARMAANDRQQRRYSGLRARLARGGPEKEENHGPAPISSEPALPTQVSLL